MQTRTRQYIVFAILVVAILWGWANNPWKTGATNTTAASPTIAALETKPIVKAQKQEYTWQRDPFDDPNRKAKTTRTYSAEPEPGLTLKAISFGGGKAMIQINDSYLFEGDKILGWEIVKIDRRTVTLKKGSHSRRLQIGKG